MDARIIEHRHEVLDDAVLEGKHYDYAALILQQQKRVDGGTDAFLPLLCDADGCIIWQGAVTYSCLEGIRQLGELLETLAYKARISNAMPFDVATPDRPSQAHG